MDLVNSFLNLVAPPMTFFSLMLFLPPFQIFKFFLSVLGTLFSEDIAGKVVLITGASSGIGESLAYEYAKRGACLVLTARRERSLHEVAERAHDLGSPDVLVVPADISRIEDCRRVIDQTMNHFGRLDHLVNNAGIMSTAMLEEVGDVTDFRAIMDINFWGMAYMTRLAAPYLRHSRGRIIALSSVASWLPGPRLSFYNASKAAISQFFETLRVEFGQDIGITLVTPGFIESELTQGKVYNREGKLVIDQDTRDVTLSIVPVMKADACAREIVRSAVRGERYVTAPSWFRVTYLWKLFFPEMVEWLYRILYLPRPGEPPTEALGKKLVDVMGGVGVKRTLYPESVQAPELKRE